MKSVFTIARLKNVVGKYGLFGAVRKTAAFCFAGLRAALPLSVLLRPRRLRRELRRLLSGDYDRIVLWRSGFGFQTALYQRPQQIARQLAKRRCLVLYETNPLYDRVASLRVQEPNLLLVNLRCAFLRRMLLRELDRVGKPKILQLYSTNRETPLREMKAFLRRGWQVLYEYVDHLSPVISGTEELPQNIREKFDYVMSHPEIPVAATAELLRQDVFRRRGSRNLFLVGNGVDHAFFQQWEPYAFEPAFQEILARRRPIVCYYGALAEWIDYDLLRSIAAEGRYSLVLIGVKYDGSFDRELRGVAGVDLLGPRDHRVLKYYAASADLLILPFLVNEITRSASPVKLFEYMALRKPIVSSDIDECHRWKSVLIGCSREDFLQQMDRALILRGDPDYLALLDREARENDWGKKAEQLLAALDEKRAPGGSPGA